MGVSEMGRAGREGEGGHLFLWPEHTCPFAALPLTITSLGSAAQPFGAAAICLSGLAALRGGFCHRYK